VRIASQPIVGGTHHEPHLAHPVTRRKSSLDLHAEELVSTRDDQSTTSSKE
jgi:hypothetical protein